MTLDTAFDKDDHRFVYRNGEAFDKGETFSGVPYKMGLKAVEELIASKPKYCCLRFYIKTSNYG